MRHEYLAIREFDGVLTGNIGIVIPGMPDRRRSGPREKLESALFVLGGRFGMATRSRVQRISI